MAKLNAFDKQCLEKIPPQELKSIADEAIKTTRLAFSDRHNFCISYCTECLKKYDNKSLIKTPCIANILTLDCLCAEHFRQKRERELCQKYLEEHKPKLDLQDFARV